MDQTTLDTLTKAGMSEKNAELYLILAELGETTVPEILKHTGLSRATVYEVLPELLAGDLIEYRKDGRVAYYRAAHPNKLLELLDQKKRQLALLEDEMQQTVRQVTGSFQLANNKPGVRFFEGRDGFMEALEDTLTTKGEILTFLDLAAVEHHVKDMNDAYVKKRRERGVHKRILLVNDAENKKIFQRYGKEHTDIRLLPATLQSFHIGMQIYDNKISYFTLREDAIVAIIIEDPQVAEIHRNMFHYLWEVSSKTETQEHSVQTHNTADPNSQDQ